MVSESYVGLWKRALRLLQIGMVLLVLGIVPELLGMRLIFALFFFPSVALFLIGGVMMAYANWASKDPTHISSD